MREGSDGNELIRRNVVEDIIFIQHYKKQYTKIFDQNGSVYFSTTKLFELEMKLSKINFWFLSRDSLVNMTKIKSFHESSGRVYFTTNPDKNSIYVTAVRAAYPRIEKFIDIYSSQPTLNLGFEGGLSYR